MDNVRLRAVPPFLSLPATHESASLPADGMVPFESVVMLFGFFHAKWQYIVPPLAG